MIWSGVRLGVDAARRRLYVTLTGTNQLRSYRIDGPKLVADRSWATVRQPNDVAVDETTGREEFRWWYGADDFPPR